MIDEGIAHHPAGTRDDIEHARGQTGFKRQFTDAQRRQRRQLGGLHDNRAAAGQGRRELPHSDHQWEIPGHDNGNHADRLAHRIGECIVSRGDDFAADLVSPARVIGERIDGRGQVLAQHPRDRFASIKTFQRSNFIRVLFHQGHEPEQDLSSL